MNDHHEPTITINGQTLSQAQAMTMRVALEGLSADLNEGLGDDEHGKRMLVMYRQAIKDIRGMIFPE